MPQENSTTISHSSHECTRIILLMAHEAVHKNYSVSGKPAGWLKKSATGDYFFLIFFKNIFFYKGDNIFKEKKNLEKKN